MYSTYRLGIFVTEILGPVLGSAQQLDTIARGFDEISGMPRFG